MVIVGGPRCPHREAGRRIDRDGCRVRDEEMRDPLRARDGMVSSAWRLVPRSEGGEHSDA